MKKLIFIFVLMLTVACSGGDYIDKPENLISESKMAEVMADLAVNDQATYTYPNSNLEAGTRFILKTHNIKPDDYIKSFKYYVIKQKMNNIVDEAQSILQEKDPKAEKYIKDKNAKSSGTTQLQNAPAVVR